MYGRVFNILTANLGTAKIIDGDALLAEEINYFFAHFKVEPTSPKNNLTSHK